MSSGNAEAIDTLERALAQAKAGNVFHVAIAGVMGDEQGFYEWGGANALLPKSQEVLKTLSQTIDMLVEARRIGPRNVNLDASYAEWPMLGTPVCWDFLIWLIDAEMTRRRLGGPAPLRVHFSHQEEAQEGMPREFLKNVFNPLLSLVGAIEEIEQQGGRHKPVYVPIDIVMASKSGEKVPLLKADGTARNTLKTWLHGTMPVTITLREAPYWKARNSKLEDWLKFAKDLEAKGESVIIIRDTEMATEPLPGFVTCPPASWRVDLRMALYEQAKCNLFISNGPAGLGLFSDRPYLYFVNQRTSTKAEREYAPNFPEWWRKSHGIKKGEQWPWALPTQKLVWETDDYRNLCAAWEKLDLRDVPPFDPSLQTDFIEMPLKIARAA